MIKKLYPGGKEKAFNMTYDDGIVQDIEFIEMLNKYGIKATFNLNSGLMFQEFAWFHDCGMVVKRLSPERAKDLYEGHEIASHTLSHPYMDSLSAEQILHEMVEDRDNLETMFDTEVSDLLAQVKEVKRRKLLEEIERHDEKIAELERKLFSLRMILPTPALSVSG